MELKYKVGDKLLIEVTVESLDLDDTNYPYDISLDNAEVRLWLSESSLESAVTAATGKLPKQGNNIEVGDIVRILKNVVYTVKTVEVDRVFVEEAIGYVLHKDIESVYKKSWEKPKELEEMSKEELIELVKKLKGE